MQVPGRALMAVPLVQLYPVGVVQASVEGVNERGLASISNKGGTHIYTCRTFAG